jgi:hypothetical protein
MATKAFANAYAPYEKKYDDVLKRLDECEAKAQKATDCLEAVLITLKAFSKKDDNA